MATVEITDANFDDLIESKEIVLLDFWADWCAPCKAFKPIYEQASERYPDVLFGTVDTETEKKLAAEFQIFSIPTLIAAKSGTVAYARPGMLGHAQLEELIQKLITLDPNELEQE